MPLEIRAIRERTKTCTVRLGDGDDAAIEIEYYPAKAGALDKDTIRELAEKSAGKSKREQTRELAALLCSIAIRWDVLSNGDPFPLDPDAMAGELDDVFLGVVLGLLYQDATEPKQNGELTSVLGISGYSPKAGAVGSPDAAKARSRQKSRS